MVGSIVSSRAFHAASERVEETAVDDVRRVRERLSAETGNDVNRLADRARETAEKLRDKLGLKPVEP
jgi:hypothetical protein